jgi:hypothetical protein
LAVLTVQEVSLTGLSLAFAAAAAGGDEFANTGREYLHVKNASAGDVTVTFDSVAPCNQGYDHNVAVVVPAGGERIIGKFEPGRFNNSNNRVAVSYSGVTSVTVAAVKM